jgi:hypothetical protein
MESNNLDFSKPSIYEITHKGQYIGFVDSCRKPVYYETHPKDLIRKDFGNGVGVLPELANHPQIEIFVFVKEKKHYTITKEKFLKVSKPVILGEITKLVCHITDCKDDNDNQLNLFDLEEK